MNKTILSLVITAAMLVVANAQTDLDNGVDTNRTHALPPPAGAGAYSLAMFTIPAVPGLEKEKPRLTVYYPVNADGAFPGLRSEKLNIITWGNGQAGVENSYKYVKLFQHWVSYGFIVVAEESPGKNRFSEQYLQYGVEKFSDWVGRQRPADQNCMTGKKADVAFGNALSNWLASLDCKQQIKYDIIAAGKSRGSVQALSFSRSDRDDIIGVICIAGCSLRFPVPPRTNVNGLFITGDRDWVYGLPAKHMTLWTYNRSTGPKQYFQRSAKVAPYGTHLGHDKDPQIRSLTTDWLRCVAHKDENACYAVLCMRKDKKNGWSDIRRDKIKPGAIALAQRADVEENDIQQCVALNHSQ